MFRKRETVVISSDEYKYQIIYIRLRVYPSRRYLDGNQIKELPPGVFAMNTKLTQL